MSQQTDKINAFKRVASVFAQLADKAGRSPSSDVLDSLWREWTNKWYLLDQVEDLGMDLDAEYDEYFASEEYARAIECIERSER